MSRVSRMLRAYAHSERAARRKPSNRVNWRLDLALFGGRVQRRLGAELTRGEWEKLEALFWARDDVDSRSRWLAPGRADVGLPLYRLAKVSVHGRVCLDAVRVA